MPLLNYASKKSVTVHNTDLLGAKVVYKDQNFPLCP